jgi:tetratricopeptide (TPR) repeat protein
MTAAFRNPVVRAGLIVALGAAVYANTLNVPFLFDDFGSIRDNTTLRAMDFGRLMHPPRENTVSGRPVANISFALNYRATRLSLPGLHLGNLLIHLAAALCLMGLIRRTLRLPVFSGQYEDSADVIAAVCAALWVVHPIETESVTYLVQRVESLAGLFILLTLYASLRAATAPKSSIWSLGASTACLFGMGTKEVAVVTPVLVVLYDRAFLFPTFAAAFRKRAPFYAALAATWIALALLIVQDGRHHSAGLHFAGFGPLDYARIQAGAVVHYLRLIFWPHPLVFDYGEPNDGVPLATRFLDWGPPAVLLIGLLALSGWAWRRQPALGFLALGFFVLLAPSSSVVPVTTEVISEHRLYLASAPVLILIVLGLDALFRRGPAQVPVALAVTGIMLLGAATVRRNAIYGSAISLWQDTVDHQPENPRAIIALAGALQDAGRNAEAEAMIARALKLSPSHAEANRKIGELEQARGDCIAALRHFNVALQRIPNNADLQYRTAVCLAKIGRPEEAIGHFRTALEYEPASAEIHSAYAGTLGRIGRFDDAIAQLQAALHLEPDSEEAWFNMGGIYARMRRYDDALKAFDRATEIKPTFAIAHERAGLVATWLDRIPEGERHLEEAARLSPKDPQPLDDLAWALATRLTATAQEAPRAVELATQASALAPESWRAWDVLAAAHAAAEDYDSAQADERKAIEHGGPGTGAPAADLQERLAMYEQHKPWRKALP